MLRKLLSLGISMLAAALAACSDGTGGSSVSPGPATPGSLIFNPPLRVATLTAADFQAQLVAEGATGQQLLALALAGTPFTSLPCGVDFHYIQYGTFDGGNPRQQTTASGALMVPTGTPGLCSGPRPILLYAHGTATDKATNLANVTNPNNTEGVLIAAMFAAFGYIVVAPNYAGYDSSPLPYHPFLNADQQSQEMIDVLTAARTALPNIPAHTTSDNGKLFVTGYSQGGFVAMAAYRAMLAAAIPVTAVGPMSGPYALEAFGDTVFGGRPNLGSTIFAPMIATSYQRQFGNVYNTPTDTTNIFAAPFAATIDALLPSFTPLSTLIQQGKLPQTTLFSSTPPTTGGASPTLDAFFLANTPSTTPAAQAPLFALGFGTTNLIINNARLTYVAEAAGNPDGAVPTPIAGVPRAAAEPPVSNPIRRGLWINDLRTAWAPTRPILLCGGGADPTVYFLNTQTIQGFFGFPAQAVLDIDTAPTGAGDPFAAAKLGFAAAKQATAQAAIAAGATDGGAAAVAQAYHGTLVPPFCTAAERGFFSQF